MSMKEPRLNLQLSAAIIGELKNSGVRHFVVSPGSRSSPMVLQLAGDKDLSLHSVIDERSAGFVGLGLSKALGAPVVLLCTSGTAGAHYLPALCEAHSAGIPLIAITADRPPELLKFGAPQTMNQRGLFGTFTSSTLMVGPDFDGPTDAHVRNEIAQLALQLTFGAALPAHINIHFREPLVSTDAFEPRIENVTRSTRFVAARPRFDEAQAQLMADRIIAAERCAIVVGPIEPRSKLPDLICELASRSNHVLLAEAASQCRFLARENNEAIAHYDAILRSGARQNLTPDFVIHVGGALTCKSLQAFVDDVETEKWVLSAGTTIFDSRHMAQQIVKGDIEGLLRRVIQLIGRADTKKTTIYGEMWRACEMAVSSVWKQELTEKLSEPSISAVVAHEIPEAHSLFVASSMPIRDFDTFSSLKEMNLSVFCNRIINGIDGSISTAAGIALAENKRAYCLLGDVALVHDISGLLTAQRLKVELTVVVINNDGGAIFEFLPIAQQREHFEKFWATPHETSFEYAAKMAGFDYASVTTVTALKSQLCDTKSARRLIEVKTSRYENAVVHAGLFKLAAVEIERVQR